MDILSYIQRINQLYGSEQQVASGKGFGSVISEEFDELSPREEQYYQQGPFSTREDFLAAKGGRVYNTRKYFKPGGLVEPGVTHYGVRIDLDIDKIRQLRTDGWTTKEIATELKVSTGKIESEVKKANLPPAQMLDKERINKRYADILKAENIEGNYSDIKSRKIKNQIKSLYYAREVNPYKKTGFSRSKELIESNLKNFDKFSKSAQTLDDFYDIFKGQKDFKFNLRAYLKGEASPNVAAEFDKLEFKTKYKNIIPKITEHLEVWHEKEPDPGKARLKAKKRALIKKYSSSEVETLINQAKATKYSDYMNQLDLSHRQQLNMDLNLSELGIEKPEINQVLIKSAERERNKLQRKNIKLIDEIKQGKNVQKSMELIAQNNDRIKAIAKMTNGRLLGVTMDLETLKPVKIKPSNVSSVDANLWNKPIKEFATDQKAMLEFKNKVLPQVVKEASAMTPQKIAAELSGLMQDEVLSKKLAADIEKLAPDRPGYYPLKAKSQEAYKLMAEKIAQGPEGIKFLNKQAVAQTMWKAIGNKGTKKCSTPLVGKAGGGRIGFQGKVCGLAFATNDPVGYMAAVKKDKEALNAFKLASQSKSKMLKFARAVMRDTMNPVGWIGGELLISGGITAAMLSEGYTTRKAIDDGLAWFLPKSVLKSRLHEIEDMAKKEGVDFETIMPFFQLETISEEHDKAQKTYLKNTDPLHAWDPQQLEYFSSKWFGKPTSKLSQKEDMMGSSEVKEFMNRLKMPSASGRGGKFYRQEAVDSSMAGMGSANRKYLDIVKNMQEPFEEGSSEWVLPAIQKKELEEIADMSATERAKANELESLQKTYDKGIDITAKGRRLIPTNMPFEEWVHKKGKGDLFFNEFQRGPNRREFLTHNLFNPVKQEPYKMEFPGRESIDFSAAPYATGGRVGLKKGKRPLSLSRRGFLQWLAGITGAGIAAGTGLIKLGKGVKTVAPKVTEEVIKRSAEGMPTYIDNLINVVKAKGTKEIVENFHHPKFKYDTVYSYKGVDVAEDAGGNIRIKSDHGGVATDPHTGKMHEGIAQEHHMQIEKGGWIEPTKTKKGIQAPDEYIEGTVRPDMDGKMKDFEEGLDTEVHKQFKQIADEVIIKKASGGSVDYDTYLPDIEDIE